MILFDARTAAENLRNVKLINRAFRVSDFSAAGDCGSLRPVVRFFRQT